MLAGVVSIVAWRPAAVAIALYLLPLMRCETFHAYPDTIHGGDRLACCAWNLPGLTPSLRDAVAATIAADSDAIVCRAVRGSETVVGLLPGGLA